MTEPPTDFSVVTDPDTLKASSPSHVTGRLCFRFGDTFFPDQGWRDLPISALSAWLAALASILLQVDNVATFWFREGSETLWARSLGDGRIVLQGLHDDEGRRRTDCFIVRMADFAQGLLTAADDVVDVARARDWASDRREKMARMAERIRGWKDVLGWHGDPEPALTGQFPDAAGYGLPPVPTAEELCIDMKHILNSHTVGGSEATPDKSLFPAHMDERQIEVTIRQAYAEGEFSWPDGVHLWVTRKEAGLDMEMWVNTASKTVETAYPLHWGEDDLFEKRTVKKIPVDVRVVVDTNTLRVNTGGSITGTVFFRCGDALLPGDHWRDFVVRLLTWWLKQVARELLVNPIPYYRDLQFMEANLVVRLWGVGPNRLELAPTTSLGWRSPDECFIVETTTLMQSLLSAAEEVLGVVEARGWASPETEELARIHRRLKELTHRE